MRTTRLVASLAIVGTIGLAGCGGGEAEDDAMIMEDTIMQRDVQEIQVPVTDTAVVRTEVDVDTAIDVDTIDDPM